MCFAAHVPRTVRIRSRAAVPQELGLARDPRPLGVAVRRIVLAEPSRQWAFDADAAPLVDGYHAFEPGNGIRWTDGDGALGVDIQGACQMELLAAMQYRLFAEAAGRTAT